MSGITPEQIDELLPQTQCGLCGHGGCMPYAEAMLYEAAPINRCPPGGVATLKALGALLGQDPAPYVAELQQQTKPKVVASIREAECIGCTKCIQACPVDAIIGTSKQMHTIITDQCTGCELCVPPCPVDCIDLLPTSEFVADEKKNRAREQFNKRNQRLKKEANVKQQALLVKTAPVKLNYIEAALLRAKQKKISSL